MILESGIDCLMTSFRLVYR